MKLNASARLSAEPIIASFSQLLASDPESALLKGMEREMLAIRKTFPSHLTWGAISPNGRNYVVGAARSKADVYAAISKGWDPYLL